MNKFKAAAGALVAYVGPLSFALLFGGLTYRYNGQHVHDVSARLQGDKAVRYVDDYTHSTGGVIAVGGALLVAWVAVSIILVLAGGAMISSRNKSWDCQGVAWVFSGSAGILLAALVVYKEWDKRIRWAWQRRRA